MKCKSHQAQIPNRKFTACFVGWGATGNQYGCIWLYNPATGRFDYSKEFSGLPRYWLEPATKTIVTFERGGMAGLLHEANRYRVEKNVPVLIWHENQDWDSDKTQFHCVVQERKDDAMVTTKDQWSQPASDWSKTEAPCDPGKLFPLLQQTKSESRP